MKTMEFADYQELLRGDMQSYFVGRWEYYKVVIDIVNRLAPRSVLELGPGQHTVLSFPNMWECPRDNANYPGHHQIDEDLIADRTLNVAPKEIIKIARTGPEVSKGPRILYFWEFE